MIAGISRHAIRRKSAVQELIKGTQSTVLISYPWHNHKPFTTGKLHRSALSFQRRIFVPFVIKISLEHAFEDDTKLLLRDTD